MRINRTAHGPETTDHQENGNISYDQTLGDRLLNADGSVLADILASYGPKVAGQLRKTFTPLDDHDIDDILQAALICLWRNAPRYNASRSSVRAYFYTIARSKAIDLLRRRSTYDDLKQKVRRVRPVTNPPPAPDESLINRCRVAVLRRVLNDLSGIDRVIILASTDGGHWAKDLERRLGIPAQKIHLRGYRIKNRIRKIMKGRLNDEQG